MMGTGDSFVYLDLKTIGQKFAQLRTMTEKGLDQMRRSLERFGQLSPVVVLKMATGYEMVDGFKRLKAARESGRLTSLQCRVLAGTDSRAAKLAIYRLTHHFG